MLKATKQVLGTCGGHCIKNTIIPYLCEYLRLTNYGAESVIWLNYGVQNTDSCRDQSCWESNFYTHLLKNMTNCSTLIHKMPTSGRILAPGLAGISLTQILLMLEKANSAVHILDGTPIAIGTSLTKYQSP